jgi:hypothetical protein
MAAASAALSSSVAESPRHSRPAARDSGLNNDLADAGGFCAGGFCARVGGTAHRAKENAPNTILWNGRHVHHSLVYQVRTTDYIASSNRECVLHIVAHARSA